MNPEAELQRSGRDVVYYGDTRSAVSFSMGEVVDEWATTRARRAGNPTAIVTSPAVYISHAAILDGVPDPSKVRRVVTPQDIARHPDQWRDFCRVNPRVNVQSGRVEGVAKPKYRVKEKQFKDGAGRWVTGQVAERIA